jgi:hypothetical protein
MTGERWPEDVVREELRRALEAREPDRTAMLNRIAANRAAVPRRRSDALRLAGSALAVLAVLGIGAGARWALGDDPGTTNLQATNLPSTTLPATTLPATNLPATTGTASTSPAPPAAVRGHPGDTQVEKGSLRSYSSVGDGESTVTLRPGAALTELELVIRVTLTPGLTDEGATHDARGGRIETRVVREPDAIVFHFTLEAGDSLQAGKWTFTAHYRHDGTSRDASADTYEATTFSVERKHPHVYGNFL